MANKITIIGGVVAILIVLIKLPNTIKENRRGAAFVVAFILCDACIALTFVPVRSTNVPSASCGTMWSRHETASVDVGEFPGELPLECDFSRDYVLLGLAGAFLFLGVREILRAKRDVKDAWSKESHEP